MRLIDADKLTPVTLTDGGYWTKEVFYKRDIDNAPTITVNPETLVKHGWWEKLGGLAMPLCSCCGERATMTWSGKYVTPPYCPSCGAKMDAEAQENA